MVKKEVASFDEKTERQMVERVLNFLGALKNPLARIGEKRAQREANPDYVAPEPEHVSRFEQKNRKDRWSETVYGETDYGNVHAKIRVQDPRDPEDIDLGPIAPTPPRRNRVTGEEELEAHPEKVSQLVIEDEEAVSENPASPNPRTS